MNRQRIIIVGVRSNKEGVISFFNQLQATVIYRYTASQILIAYFLRSMTIHDTYCTYYALRAQHACTTDDFYTIYH
jgi:hypothetical protein